MNAIDILKKHNMKLDVKLIAAHDTAWSGAVPYLCKFKCVNGDIEVPIHVDRGIPVDPDLVLGLIGGDLLDLDENMNEEAWLVHTGETIERGARMRREVETLQTQFVAMEVPGFLEDLIDYVREIRDAFEWHGEGDEND